MYANVISHVFTAHQRERMLQHIVRETVAQ
jgi:hypothetical protein